MKPLGRQVRAAVLLLVLGLLWLPAGCSEAAVQTAEVEAVRVEVTAGNSLPLPVQARMEKSILAISQQLLEGKEVAAVEDDRQSYETVIRQVFDKVLIGYTVESAAVVPGRETLVRVSLLPWQDTIQSVQVDISVEGMSPEIERLLYQDVAGMESIFRESLQDLPIAAIEWTHGLLKKQVAAFLQERAPEFKADFDVEVADRTQVKVVLYPLLPVVRNVDLNMRSDTMLNAGLLVKRKKMQEGANQLIGVPVHFTARHQQELEAYLADILNQDTAFRQWDMHTQVKLTPGERVTVMSRSDSDIYRIRLEGWADMGNNWGNKNDASLMARLHFGRKLSQRDELFVQVDFYPQSVKWTWDAGYRYRLPSGTSVGLRYDIRDDYVKLELQQPLSRKWLLRYEYSELGHHSEYGIRYRLHDFLSLEYALDSHNSWLRFIGYF